MQQLASYVGGRWVAGAAGGQTLVNPATEAPLATASTQGLDLAAALEFARGSGGPALRELSFGQRGTLLKGMADALQGARDELLEIGIANGGNTRSDAKFDVDGAIATLLAYAELGAQLGDGRFLVDGEGLQLGRSPRFHGQHVSVPRARRRSARQRVQLSRLGPRREGRRGAARRHAGAVQAGHHHRARRAPRRRRSSSKRTCCPRARSRCWSAAPRDLLDHLAAQDVLAFTGSGEHRRAPARAAERDPPRGARERRGRQPERRRARPRRGRRPAISTSSS